MLDVQGIGRTHKCRTAQFCFCLSAEVHGTYVAVIAFENSSAEEARNNKMTMVALSRHFQYAPVRRLCPETPEDQVVRRHPSGPEDLRVPGNQGCLRRPVELEICVVPRFYKTALYK